MSSPTWRTLSLKTVHGNKPSSLWLPVRYLTQQGKQWRTHRKSLSHCTQIYNGPESATWSSPCSQNKAPRVQHQLARRRKESVPVSVPMTPTFVCSLGSILLFVFTDKTLLCTIHWLKTTQDVAEDRFKLPAYVSWVPRLYPSATTPRLFRSFL